MAFLARGKKEDLRVLAEELGEEPAPNLRMAELKTLITESEAYEEEFTKGVLETIINQRKEKEQKEFETRKQEMEFEMRKREREFEERRMAFEIRKLEIQGQNMRIRNNLNLNTTSQTSGEVGNLRSESVIGSEKSDAKGFENDSPRNSNSGKIGVGGKPELSATLVDNSNGSSSEQNCKSLQFVEPRERNVVKGDSVHDQGSRDPEISTLHSLQTRSEQSTRENRNGDSPVRICGLNENGETRALNSSVNECDDLRKEKAESRGIVSVSGIAESRPEISPVVLVQNSEIMAVVNPETTVNSNTSEECGKVESASLQNRDGNTENFISGSGEARGCLEELNGVARADILTSPCISPERAGLFDRELQENSTVVKGDGHLNVPESHNELECESIITEPGSAIASVSIADNERDEKGQDSVQLTSEESQCAFSRTGGFPPLCGSRDGEERGNGRGKSNFSPSQECGERTVVECFQILDFLIERGKQLIEEDRERFFELNVLPPEPVRDPDKWIVEA